MTHEIQCEFCGVKMEAWQMVPICSSCSALLKKFQDKLTLGDNSRELERRAEEYIKRAMDGSYHTCGYDQGLGGWAFSSDCLGCCPDTAQHYHAAASMVIAWASNEWKRKIMREWILPQTVES